MAPVRKLPPSLLLRQNAHENTSVLAATIDTVNRVTKPAKKPRKKQATFECSTCSREATARAFPKHPYTAHCQHSPMTTCIKCTKKWITIQLNDKTWDKISCPECPQIMRSDDIKIHGDATSYDRYQHYEYRVDREKIPGWRWCLNPLCNQGQVHSPSIMVKLPVVSLDKERKRKANLLPRSANDSPVKKTMVEKHDAEDFDIFICQACNAKACVPCDRPYHEGETCEQYLRRNKAHDESDRLYIDTVTKKCPGCSARIEKKDGCDHMICGSCRTNFCWLCLVDYEIIPTSGHAKECLYSQPGVIDPHNVPADRIAHEAMVLEQMRRARHLQRNGRRHRVRRAPQERGPEDPLEQDFIFFEQAVIILRHAFDMDGEGNIERALHRHPPVNVPEQRAEAREALVRILAQALVNPINLNFEALNLNRIGPVFLDHLVQTQHDGAFVAFDPDITDTIVVRFRQLFPQHRPGPDFPPEA